MQAAINACSRFASEQRFLCSETKNKIIYCDPGRKITSPASIWKLNGKDIEIVETQEHIGMIRNSNNPNYGMVEE